MYKLSSFLKILLIFFITALSQDVMAQYVPVSDATGIVYNHFNSIEIDNPSSPDFESNVTRYKYFETLRDRLSNASEVESTLDALDSDLITNEDFDQATITSLRNEADILLAE